MTYDLVCKEVNISDANVGIRQGYRPYNRRGICQVDMLRPTTWIFAPPLQICLLYTPCCYDSLGWWKGNDLVHKLWTSKGDWSQSTSLHSLHCSSLVCVYCVQSQQMTLVCVKSPNVFIGPITSSCCMFSPDLWNIKTWLWWWGGWEFERENVWVLTLTYWFWIGEEKVHIINSLLSEEACSLVCTSRIFL